MLMSAYGRKKTSGWNYETTYLKCPLTTQSGHS